MSDDEKPVLSLVPAFESDGAEPGAPEPPSEEKVDESIEREARALAAELPMAAAFAPLFPEDHIPRLALFMVNEQRQINAEILPDMADPNSDTQMINVVLQRTQARLVEAGVPNEAVFPAYKRIDDQNNPQLVIPQVMVFAFLMTPVARAILRMHGWAYSFAKSKGPDAKPPLVMM
jgi:hypothetical protein